MARRRDGSRSRGGGKAGGLFRPPKHKWIARLVDFTSVSGAREGAERLVEILETGRRGRRRIGSKTALAIARAIQNAANRAEVTLYRRRNLRPETRKRYRELVRIFNRYAAKAWRIYNSKYREG